MTEPQDPYVGKMIGECLVRRPIKRGGMGAVYLAFDHILKREVAIKVMDVACRRDDDAVRRFHREARILGGLNHKNVAQVHRAGQFNGIPYYVMEYIDGPSLKDLLSEKGKLTGSRCVNYLIQAAEGLRAAADQNVIHRDVKPANIMVTSEDVIKIVDFGISKILDEDTYKTQTGMFMGTPRYMAPEQTRGYEVDRRTDIYSLGATFYHLIAGRPPFDSDSALRLMEAHQNDPVPDIKLLAPHTPDRVCNIIYGMLMKRPDDRFQNYNQIIAALRNIHGKVTQDLASFDSIVQHDLPPISPADKARATPLSLDDRMSLEREEAERRHSRFILITGVVVVVALVLAVMFRPRTPPQTAAPPPTNRAASEMSAMMKTLKEAQDMNQEMRMKQARQIWESENALNSPDAPPDASGNAKIQKDVLDDIYE
ncbi:serine/threonine protein kinase [Candidatus Sumerlaeota bacterium]|nr:serine/threonine protein kinase [Candidatus Sumerlaeota bacterium]